MGVWFCLERRSLGFFGDPSLSRLLNERPGLQGRMKILRGKI